MSANQNFNHNLEISIALKKQSWKPAFSQACKKYIVNSTKRGARLYSGKHSGWLAARSDFKSPPIAPISFKVLLHLCAHSQLSCTECTDRTLLVDRRGRELANCPHKLRPRK